VNTLDAWVNRAAGALGLDPADLDRDLVLGLTRDVAHGVARPAAPLTAFLVGLAAGRAGGGRDDVARAVAAAGAAVETWTADPPSDEAAGRPEEQHG
jgi:hypothetical protein